mgnify:CR=1 FL=1
MKKLFTLLIAVLLLGAASSFGQVNDPGWTFDPGPYENDMQVTAVVEINSAEVTSGGVLAAFVGDDKHVDGATTQESYSNGDGSYGTVAQLESMVRDYCGSVEGTIGRQQIKIDELLAFCDHLEKEVAGMPLREGALEGRRRV